MARVKRLRRQLTGGNLREQKLRKEHKNALHHMHNYNIISASLSEFRLKQRRRG